MEATDYDAMMQHKWYLTVHLMDLNLNPIIKV